MKLKTWTIVILAALTAGCAVSGKNPSSSNIAPPSGTPAEQSADDDFDLLDEDLEKQLEEQLEEQKVKVADPLEPINRIMYSFNDKLYFWVIKPCASVCKKTVPKPARISIRNFFNNLGAPARFVSCHLQGKHKAADKELHRFALNTTVGILGFGDPARDKWGLESADEDLGQALAKHGFGSGPYIVLPLFGPSTLRDSVGLVGDQFLSPVRYVKPQETSIALSAGEITNDNSFRIGEYESFKSAAYDPYIAMRQAYIQYRKKQVEE